MINIRMFNIELSFFFFFQRRSNVNDRDKFYRRVPQLQ